MICFGATMCNDVQMHGVGRGAVPRPIGHGWNLLLAEIDNQRFALYVEGELDALCDLV